MGWNAVKIYQLIILPTEFCKVMALLDEPRQFLGSYENKQRKEELKKKKLGQWWISGVSMVVECCLCKISILRLAIVFVFCVIYSFI